jgi:hypothetical protein
MSDSEAVEYSSSEEEDTTYDLRILMMCGTYNSLHSQKTQEIIQTLCDHGHLNKLGKRPIIRSITNMSEFNRTDLEKDVNSLTSLYRSQGITFTHIESELNCAKLDVYTAEKYNVIFDEYCPGICAQDPPLTLKAEVSKVVRSHLAKDGRFVTVVPRKITQKGEIEPIPEETIQIYVECLPAMGLKLESIYNVEDSIETCYYVYGKTNFVAARSRARSRKHPLKKHTKKSLKQTRRAFKNNRTEFVAARARKSLKKRSKKRAF